MEKIYRVEITYETPDADKGLPDPPCSGSSAFDEIKRMRPVLYAQLGGATCAREGKKMDANPYPPTNDLHFQWLQAWTIENLARMEAHEQGTLLD